MSVQTKKNVLVFDMFDEEIRFNAVYLFARVWKHVILTLVHYIHF